ncbi:MAG TPA: hypothetical protein VIQ00_10220 [Chitinophagaceae bacterium]
MILVFANNIKTDYSGYVKLLQALALANKSPDSSIVFDFKNVQFFEANLCAVLGAIVETIRTTGKTVKFININYRVEAIMRKNRFLCDHGFPNLPDGYHTTIEYQKFNPEQPDDDQRFNLYIQKQLLAKPEFPSHSELLGVHISRNIFEIYENARTHGKCNFIHTCGQYFPNMPLKPLNVTIVDRGINFKENVGNFLKQNIEGNKAIEWAIKKGNTTKTGNISGGLGLDIIFDFVKHNKGKIQIISADGFWEWNKGNIVSNVFPFTFEGTIANIRFNLNDPRHYILMSEQTDFDNIF